MGHRDEHASRAVPRAAIAGTADSRAREEDRKNGVHVPVQRHGPVIVVVSPGTKQDQNDKKLKKKVSMTIDDKINRFIEEKKKSFNEWGVHNCLQNGILHEVIGCVQITVIFSIRIYEFGRVAPILMFLFTFLF